MAGYRAKENSSSSSTIPEQKYDVFLSFSGVDTRKNFTDHLLAALERNGIQTFIDDTKLTRGEDIASELPKAIEDSRISLVVFSKNYAASRWCLDELVKIMECRKSFQHIVLPIFYNVNPADVRGLTGTLAEVFAIHKQCFKEDSDCMGEKWREALTQFANLSGWVLQNMASRQPGCHEAKFIEKIVDEVENKLNRVHLSVADHPVGIKPRLENLTRLLCLESNGVRIVAIWGIGGIGKTTIAKAAYNLLHRSFEGGSFMANVRETSKQPNGIVVLQEQLVSDILRNEIHNIRNFHEGLQVIKRRVLRRRVLLIIDDVDDVQQLKALAICRELLHPGSRIIITTRDISSLSSLQVDEVYTPEELNKEESLHLFSWNAFKKSHPIQGYAELAEGVLHHIGGIPLALEVLGSFMFNKSKCEWRCAMTKLKRIPHDDVQEKLKISFDSLSKEERELFLDISCFFVGMDQDFTIKILKGCNFFPEIGIRVLTDRCLIKLTTTNQIVMHDMIRDMGREIVRQESVKEPGRRSRLWYGEDALEVLRDGTGTEAVEGICLNLPEPKDVQVNAKAFEKMDRLRLLHLNYIHLNVGYEHISKRLVWLCWIGFPLKCMPKLSMENLVALDLRHSNLKQVWKETKIMEKLRFLNLSHCYYLTRTPDFSGLNNLEELFLNDCTRLVKVDESISYLNKLLVLDFRNCKSLRKLPSSIWMLKSLECLNISSCPNLEHFAGFEGSPAKSGPSFLSSWALRAKRMDSIVMSLASVQASSCLKRLDMQKCNLSHLPSEIGSLISLTNLDLRGNNLPTLPGSIGNLTCLQKLRLADNNAFHLPCEVGSLVSLLYLDLRGNNFHSLPDSMRNLTCLKVLLLARCANLESLPELPVSLVLAYANNCRWLETMSIESNWLDAPCMVSYGCLKLLENNFANNFRTKLLQYKGLSTLGNSIDIFLPGDEIPNWFQYQSTGPRLSFIAPLVNQKIIGWISCVVFTSDSENASLWGVWYDICNKTSGFQGCYEPLLEYYRLIYRDQVWLGYLPLRVVEMQLEGGDEVEISIEVNSLLRVKKCGINLIYQNDEKNTEASGSDGGGDEVKISVRNK